MRNSTIGFVNAVVPITGNYTFSEEDGIGSLQAGFVSGSTVTLPGPGSGHNAPNNGDTYVIADPQNVLNAGAKTLVVNGGGYKFLAVQGAVTGGYASASFGSLIFEGQVESTNAPVKCAIAFTFDGNQNVWIVN
jgi:hypothetical protein